MDLNLTFLAKFLYFCDSSWLVSVVYQIEFRPLSPPHLESPGPPVSSHRCVSLNLSLWRWWGIWPAAGLFPKTHYPLDLDLFLNSINLALCESGCDYSCKGCKYCCFKSGKLRGRLSALEVWRRFALYIFLPARMSLSHDDPAPATSDDHCWLHEHSFNKLKESLLSVSPCDYSLSSTETVGLVGWLECLSHFLPSICLWPASCISYSHSWLLSQGRKRRPLLMKTVNLPSLQL